MMYFTLRVNLDESLGQVSIRRLTNLGKPGRQAAGTTNTYEVRLDGRKMGTVEHRYDDGAFLLASKALALVSARTKRDAP